MGRKVKGSAPAASTCLFTRLESACRVSDSPVSLENVIYDAFVLMGGGKGLFLYIAFGEKMESVEKLGRIRMNLSPLYYNPCNQCIQPPP